MSAYGDEQRRRLLARFGAGALPWWDALPELVRELADRWRLSIAEPVGRATRRSSCAASAPTAARRFSS